MERIHGGEEEAKPQGQALDLPINLCSYPHLWPRTLGSDQKNEIVGTNGQKKGFLRKVGGRTLKDRSRSAARH